MASITEIAEKFFVAYDEGKGWEGCKEFCKPDATFSVQAEPLADITTLEQYTDWMTGSVQRRGTHTSDTHLAAQDLTPGGPARCAMCRGRGRPHHHDNHLPPAVPSHGLL